MTLRTTKPVGKSSSGVSAGLVWGNETIALMRQRIKRITATCGTPSSIDDVKEVAFKFIK